MSRMTVSQGAAVSMGAVLGTGVIALPALAAQAAGPASLVAWGALILLSVPLAMTFAALGARHPDSGGVSTYVRRAFGPRTAAIVGWSFYTALMVGAPPTAMFGGAYVAAAFGGDTRTTFITAALLILTVTATNAGGVRVSGRVQLGLAIVLAILLLAVTIIALPHARVSNLHPFAPHGWFAIGTAAAVLVWGFAGWEAVTSLAAEFQDPKRDLPRATMIALVVVGVIYLGVALASVLVLGASTGTTKAPLADLLAISIGGPARKVTAIIALLLTLGTMNAFFAGTSKLGAALGRDGALPAWLARGSEVGGVPRRSLAVITVISAISLTIIGVTGTPPRVPVLLTTGDFILVYVLGTAAALRLLPRRTWAHRAAMIAFASSILLFIVSGWYVLWALGIACVALLYVRRRALEPLPVPVPAAVGE